MKKETLIMFAIVGIILAISFKIIPLEIARTGMLVCPGKPVTLEEWTFPSLWATKPPECVADPNGNAVIYASVDIFRKSDKTGWVYSWVNTVTVPCAYGIKLADVTFTVPTDTPYGEFYVFGTYSDRNGNVFHTYTDSFSMSSSGCAVCTAGQHKCNGDYLLTCTSDGVYNVGGYLCQFGCNDPGAGNAYCTAKTPNYKHCLDDKTYEQYSSDGTQVAGTYGCDMLETCVEGQGCVSGGGGCYGDADCKACFTHCINHKCTVTGSQPNKPCANAYWQDYPTCKWNTVDCTNYTETCGNGICGVGENVTNCPIDCGNEYNGLPWYYYVLGIGGFALVIYGITRKR